MLQNEVQMSVHSSLWITWRFVCMCVCVCLARCANISDSTVMLQGSAASDMKIASLYSKTFYAHYL